MQAILTLLLALFVSMVLVPPLARAASILGLVDHPGERKIHTRLIPRTGGLAIVLGTLTPILLWRPLDQADIAAFTAAVAALLVTGLVDDRFGLGYRAKLIGQIAAAVLIATWGDVTIHYIPFTTDYELPAAAAIPLTVFVLVGVTNAVNLSDGLDGLAGGLSLIALGGIALLAYEANDAVVLLLALAMIGATSGFLRFNTHPAQIFMGDTGSQFLGFGVGVLAILVTQKADSAVSKLIPVLILGIPILDTLSVMVRRIAVGRSPFSADRRHLHHQLLEAGLTQARAVTLVYVSQGLLVVSAYLLRFSADWAVLLTYLTFSGVVLAGIGLAQSSAWPLRLTQRGSSPFPPSLSKEPGRDAGRLSAGSLWALAVAVLLILSTGAALAPNVGADIAILAAILGTCELFALAFAPRALLWIDRLAAYVASVAVVYLSAPALTAHPVWVLAVFLTLGGLVALRIRFSQVAFKASPLDVLILLTAAVLPSLPGEWFESYALLVLESVALFYAIEILAAGKTCALTLLRFGSISSLGILAIKGTL